MKALGERSLASAACAADGKVWVDRPGRDLDLGVGRNVETQIPRGAVKKGPEGLD